MTLKTGKQYLESIKAVAFTFDAAHDEKTKDLFCVESSLNKETINRFTHLHQSPQDLVNKVKMQRHCGIQTGCCFQRCVGLDAANAIFSTTFEADQKNGTDYHERFRTYWSWVQENDLMVDGAMTDPKGDRGKRPCQQADPDLFLRVTDRKPGGVVIRGAKLHQTGMLNSHEILIMPTMAMRDGEDDWAVCCAVPTTAKGIHHIYGRQINDTRKLEADPMDTGNPVFGGQEVMTVFEDVFVPTDRVFMDGEIEFSGGLVERFASYHRQSYGGCKSGVGDLLIGATALASERCSLRGQPGRSRGIS